MRTITASEKRVLHLGSQGEHLAQSIRFPETAQWRSEYENGIISLWHQRPGENAHYPCELAFTDDGVAVWMIAATDTQIASKGEQVGHAELRCTAGDVIVKSQIYTTTISPSLAGGEIAPPAPCQSWVDRVCNAAETAQSSAAYIEENLGDMHAALDGILAMQEAYIGGGGA